jgi:hypothetical protein
MKRSSFQNRVSKSMPKKFYEIDPWFKNFNNSQSKSVAPLPKFVTIFLRRHYINFFILLPRQILHQPSFLILFNYLWRQGIHSSINFVSCVWINQYWTGLNCVSFILTQLYRKSLFKYLSSECKGGPLLE